MVDTRNLPVSSNVDDRRDMLGAVHPYALSSPPPPFWSDVLGTAPPQYPPSIPSYVPQPPSSLGTAAGVESLAPAGYAKGGFVPLRRGIARYQEGTEDVGLGAHEQVLDMLRQVNFGISSGRSGDDDQRQRGVTRAGEQGYEDMAQQRQRGVAHYQGGSEDTQQSDALPLQSPVATQRPLVAAQSQVPAAPIMPAPAPAPAPAFESFRHLLGDAIGMRGQAARDVAFSGGPPSTERSPLSTMGSMVTGGFGDVLADPKASAFSHYLAGINQAAQTNERVQNLSRGPSAVEKLFKGMFGDQADWKNIQDRDQVAQTLGHPLVQQHFMNNPDHLAAAEKDPVGYVQSPVFRDILQRTVGANAEAAANLKVTPENHQDVVNKTLNTPGATVDQANAVMNPHFYTKEEFRKAMLGAPMQVVQMLFGNQLAHVTTPQEKAATELFDRLHGDYVEAGKKLNKMELERQVAKDKNLPPPEHSRYVLWGKNEYDQSKEERDKAYNATMDALKAAAGVTEKPPAIIRPVKP